MSRSKNEFDDFAQKLERLQKDKPQLMGELAAREGAEIVRLVQGKTPEDTGLLRESWHFDTLAMLNTEKSSTVWITNTVEYAPHIEYGHRMVNKAGKTVGYVKGFFMLRAGIKYYKDTLMKKRVDKFWKEQAEKYLN